MPAAKVKPYLPVRLVGICCGLYFLHLSDSRLYGAAVVYTYKIGLLWLGI